MVELVEETPRAKSIALELPDWAGHRPGQHVDVRLTAEDGYQAQRSYSIASAPEDDHVSLTVERLEDGEVSPYLVDELRPGDELELRGPIGGYFVWEQSLGGPLMLVAGGSGIVPLRAMLRHHRAIESTVPVRLLYSARSLAEVIYRDELATAGADGAVDVRLTLTRDRPPSWRGYARRIDRELLAEVAWPADEQPLAEVIYRDELATAGADGAVDVRPTLTRDRPPSWRGYARRIDRELLAEVAWPPDEQPLAYVCGPTGFVERAAGELVALGHEPGRIRTERFGPTGG